MVIMLWGQIGIEVGDAEEGTEILYGTVKQCFAKKRNWSEGL